MTAVDTCLRQIEEIRDVAHGAQAAYVARSRVGRLVLSATRFAATQIGMPLPERPLRMEVPADASSSSQGLIACCNRLLDIAKTITQPSEPLDDRWRSGWAAMLSELDDLETQLTALRTVERE